MLRFILTFVTLIVPAASATLPLYFEPNLGQAPAGVEYLSRANGVTSYLAANRAAFRVGHASVLLELLGARGLHAEPLDRLPGVSSYFTGSDRSQWPTRIPQFGKVIYRNVYPGIDLVYYGNQGRLEYDFQLAPGADASAIHIRYRGVNGMRLEHGDLLLVTGSGDLRQRRPTVYQTINGKRREIEASYRLDANGEVRVRVANYDRTRTLVVDPVIEYATYFGGSGEDSANAVKVDAAGNVYIAGSVATPASSASPFIPASNNVYNTSAAVIKYSPSLNAILYVAQVGSDGTSVAGRLDVDASGSVYLTGFTNSASFPLVNAAVKTILSGGFTPFVTKIAPDGSTLAFSTYFGATGLDQFGDIAAGSDGSAYVTGTAVARDFPVTDQSLNTAGGTQAYVAKFGGDGKLAFSRLFGGTTGSTQGNAIALDGSGNIYIAGATNSTSFPAKSAFQSSFLKDPLVASMLGLRTAFAAKLSPDAKTLVYSTLLGGSGDDTANAAAVDNQGNLYLGGATTSIDLPLLHPAQSLQAGMQNGFVAELNPQGNGLVFSTYLGGAQKDSVQALALDANGNIYVAGSTNSPDFPTENATSASKAKASIRARNAFAAKFAAGGRGIVFATLFGGSQDDSGAGIAADAVGAAYLVGMATSSDFPTSNAFQASFGGAWDMFLVKLSPDSTPASSITALPVSLSFTVVTGGAAPGMQVIDIAPAGSGTPGTFTASADTTTGGNWLSITTGAGNSPGQIGVSVAPDSLAIGVYRGSVKVVPGSGPTAVVPVSLHIVPATPVLSSVTPAQFDSAHFDVLNPPATLPTVTLTISGSGFVSGATAWITAFVPVNMVAYPATVVDANTLQVVLPLSVQGTPITLTVSNPGTPQSNPLNLLEGKPVIGASRVSGSVVPGQTVIIGGINLGPMVPFIAPTGSNVTTLGNAQVLFDGVAAQLVAAFFMQVRAIVPASVAGKTSTKIVVKYFDQSSAPLTVGVDGNAAPDPLGPGVSAVLNPDGTINSATNPASVGAVVMLVIDIGQLPSPDAVPASTTIGGLTAPMVPMTTVTGHPGKEQFQVQVPQGVQTGPSVPVVVQFKNADATARLTIAIQ